MEFNVMGSGHYVSCQTQGRLEACANIDGYFSRNDSYRRVWNLATKKHRNIDATRSATHVRTACRLKV